MNFTLVRFLSDSFSLATQTTIAILAIGLACTSTTSSVSAQEFKTSFTPLIESACIHCHDESTDTGLDFDSLGHDLTDPDTFRKWESVFDRVADGEMPPASEDRPDPAELKTGLDSLKTDLLAASVAKQKKVGRVPARRLTKLEFGYTLKDLLYIDSDITSNMPNEVESGSFDTVGETQRISAIHMESYLQAADEALDQAIKLGRNPFVESSSDFSSLEDWHETPLNQGGSVTRKLKYGKGVALFRDVDYLTLFPYRVSTPGVYRLTSRVAAYQSKKPITAKLIVKNGSGSRLIKIVDLEPGETQTVVVETVMQPGDIAYLTLDLDRFKQNQLFQSGGAKDFKGPGLAIMEQKVAGPIFDSWPPPSTRQIFGDDVLASTNGTPIGPYKINAPEKRLNLVRDIVSRLSSRLFRRPVNDEELAGFVKLAQPIGKDERSLVDMVKVPLRSMLTSPQFLMFNADAREFDDYALANRLSYFLWKSMPDEELFELAKLGKLNDSKILAEQVERMLANKKSNRFVRDFLGQWLQLNKVNATTPDDGLYPEFDEILGNAIPKETEYFFTELINENLSLTNLIDSDFTFLNRRLAKLYRIPGVKGQEFRKVTLPKGSPRGGVLTQAAILKTSANGTVTSPVTRGNFVLANFMGTPPSPPPADIGSIEPDTRGKTTIREILAAHRDIESCNVCHREIDPPGFALESFDPIGRFRSRYRISGGESKFGEFTVKNPPRNGRKIDPSGVTADGKPFAGIREFKKHLMDQKEQVARNFISRMVVYSTGAEIQFADRDEIESILEQTRQDNFLVKDILHKIVQSKIFRNR